MLDIGDRVIDGVPSTVKDLAIEWFGSSDKAALLVGIFAALGSVAAVVGILAVRRNRWIGHVGAGGVAAIGAVAALGRRTGDASVDVVVPSLVAGITAGAVLWALPRVAARRPEPGGSDGEVGAGPTRPTQIDRRRLLVGLGAVAAVAATAGATGRWLNGRLSVAASRAGVALGVPARAAPPVPAGAELDLTGLTPLFTPNADFYRIDTALTIPQVPAESWTLRITGMVDDELELTYDELLASDLIETDITLTCVSNEIGGGLVGNARWVGAPLAALLARAGPQAGADQVVGRSVDGYTCGFPLAAALDGRDAIVATSMNGQPLPLAHGFPARLVVPGLYGYVSATKWLAEIELTTFDAFDHYWERRGWAEQAPIETMSRIDTPRGLDRVPPGPTAIAGVAWAQTRGISGVQVRIDDDEWVDAELAAAVSDDTWRQWLHRWDATPGRHQLSVRGIDGTGAIQTAQRVEPIPSGATGHHTIVVLVDDAS